MDGGKRTVQPDGDTKFLEGQIGLCVQERAELAPMTLDDERLASGTVVLGTDLADAPTLLQELLDQAQRHAKTVGHLLPSAFSLGVSRQNAFAEIQRECFHFPTVTYPKPNGYSFV